MICKRFSALLLIIALLPPGLTQVSSKEIDLVISGGRLIDGYDGQPRDNMAILVSGERIQKIADVDSISIPQGARVIDANGMTILPGLWESHGHLFHIGEGDPAEFPQNFKDRTYDVMAAVARTSLHAGITSFRDTGGPIEPQLQLRKAIESGELEGPRLYFAGPILRQRQPGSNKKDKYRVGSVREARQATEAVIALGVDQIKVYGFWDVEILRAVTDTAHRAGLGVDADVRHVTAYRTAIEAGVDRLHHVFTADPLSSYSEEDFRLLVRGLRPSGSGPSANILRGPYIVPTIEMRNAYVRMLDFPEMLDHPRYAQQYPADIYAHLRQSWKNPSSIPWGIGARERIKQARTKLRHFVSIGGREQLVAGTDAGAPFNLHSPLTREMQNLARAGLTPMEVIQSATLRPAQMQGVADQLGTVSEGKLADIIIVDGDPLQDITLLQHRIVTVIKGGKIYTPDNTSLR